MYKKVQVVLLPSEEPTSLWSYKGRRLQYNQANFNNEDDTIYYDLCFLSDDKLEDSDWCFLKENHYINGGIGRYNTKKAIGFGLHNSEFFKKIITTTDTSLKLPQIPEDWVEQYVEKYNSGQIIKEVLVKYEKNPYWGREDEPKYIVETSLNNVVFIKPAKDSYNKEEVEELLWKVRAFHINNPTGAGGYSEEYCREKLKSWIKESL